MENTAMQILDQKIIEVENLIESNKKEVGGLFLKIQTESSLSDLTPENLFERFKEIEKMSPLIKKHESYTTKLETLQKAKAEIEQAETGLIAK